MLHRAIVGKLVQNADLRARLLDTEHALLAGTYDRERQYLCDWLW
ncbi:unnamed protein product [Anisakis simplex]|uniref:Uncharacterized protein n=1 Tax=Anisakis simplex TaxID=6269 RepID=A0A3P6UEN5_ANISI|nr:unnamed protein product [Anisakis simplex]